MRRFTEQFLIIKNTVLKYESEFYHVLSNIGIRAWSVFLCFLSVVDHGCDNMSKILQHIMTYEYQYNSHKLATEFSTSRQVVCFASLRGVFCSLPGLQKRCLSRSTFPSESTIDTRASTDLVPLGPTPTISQSMATTFSPMPRTFCPRAS